MPLKLTRDVLNNMPVVVAAVGDRISPVADQLNETFPRIVLTATDLQPINSLSGWAGLDRNEVQIEVWATDYTTAKHIADAARDAMNAAGHLTLGMVNNQFEFSPDVTAFLVGYIFQVWK